MRIQLAQLEHANEKRAEQEGGSTNRHTSTFFARTLHRVEANGYTCMRVTTQNRELHPSCTRVNDGGNNASPQHHKQRHRRAQNSLHTQQSQPSPKFDLRLTKRHRQSDSDGGHALALARLKGWQALFAFRLFTGILLVDSI